METLVPAKEEIFTTLFSASPDGMVISRLRDGVCLAINPAFTTLTGYSAAEALGRSTVDDLGLWMAPEDRSRFLAGLQQPEGLSGVDITLRRKDGALRHMQVSTWSITYQGEPCLVTVGRDLTAQIQTEQARQGAEAALRESNARLVKAQRVASMGFLDWNLKSDELFCSAEVYRLYGVSSATAPTTSTFMAKVVHPEDMTRVQTHLDLAIRGIQPYDLDHRINRPDGQVLWVHAHAELTRDADGQPDRLLGTIVDITARKQAELALEQARADLEQRVQARTAELTVTNAALAAEIAERKQAEEKVRTLNAELEQRVAARTAELVEANTALRHAARLKDEFLGTMSHELRTPLTNILGLSEALQLLIYGPLTERQLKALGSIRESGEHLLGLITDLLDLSKLEAGRLELQLGPVGVEDLCEASLRSIRQPAQKKNLRVSRVYAAHPTILYADARRLKQMLVNLLSNAVKFTPAGGEIGLRVEGDAARQSIRFTVWDNGIGIAPEDLPRLFQPFTQLNSRLAREYEGSGLGLALVQRMAELHDGEVTVESEGVSGKGSRFTITLPWRVTAEATAPASPAAE